MATGNATERLKKRALNQIKYGNSEKGKATFKRYRERNKDRIRLIARNTYLKATYGITQDDYEAILKSQLGRCATCEASAPNKKGKYLHVDHCHSTGKIRGLLCGSCNTSIGLLNESPLTTYKVFRYLLKHKYE